MKHTILVCTAAVVFAGSAWGQDKETTSSSGAGASAQGAGMDMMKMGPMARKPTNEKETKKAIESVFKRLEDVSAKGLTAKAGPAHKGALDDMISMTDFPVYMMTDQQNNAPKAEVFNHDDYVSVMRPTFENLPKNMKVTHKPTITVLSDSLANVVDEVTMTVGSKKMIRRNAGLLVKRDGQWKWKVMAEAGWGEMGPQGGGAGK